jgi:hypothetical protein
MSSCGIYGTLSPVSPSVSLWRHGSFVPFLNPLEINAHGKADCENSHISSNQAFKKNLRNRPQNPLILCGSFLYAGPAGAFGQKPTVSPNKKTSRWPNRLILISEMGFLIDCRPEMTSERRAR